MWKNYIKFFVIILTLWQISGCTNNRPIEVYHPFPENMWNRFDLIKLETIIDQTDINYDIWLHIEYDSSYPFDSLYINVAMFLPSGEIRVNEYRFDMKDKYGAFLSQLSEGKGEQFFLLREDFSFSEPGIFIVEIECLIPRVEIKGVQNIGIILKRAENNK